MAISDRITSIEEHIKESYQELKGIGIDTTGVNNNLENIPKLIDGYWETLPKVTGEGTSITLDNTKEGKMKINLKGNTSQATSILPSEYTQVDYITSSGTQYIDTGYLAKGSLKVITDIEYTSTVSGNQFIYGGRDSAELNTNSLLLSNNGTRFRNDYNTKNSLATTTISNLLAKWHIVKDKGSLTITSSDNQNITQTISNATFSSSYNVYIFTCNNASNVLNPASYRLYTFKMYDNDVLVRNFVPCYRNSDNEVGLYDLVNNVFYTNAGTGVFTYGSTSVSLPNPDFPIPINVVSGDNSINVCGKNLFNGETELGTFNNSTGEKTTSTNTRRSVNKILVKPSTQYIFSQDGVSFAIRVYYYQKNGTYISTEANSNGIFTTPSNAYYVNFISDRIVSNYNDIQLEQGNQATTYEAYKGASYPINLGDIELCKIGDYQDSIVKDNGKWYLRKATGKVDLSNCSWVTTYNIGNGRKIVGTEDITDVKYASVNTELVKCFAEKYIEHTGSGMSGNSARNHISIDVTKVACQVEKALTPTGNFIYPLATPTYTEITDSTLLSQLNALAKSYASQTNISQENNDLASILNATALEEME